MGKSSKRKNEEVSTRSYKKAKRSSGQKIVREYVPRAVGLLPMTEIKYTDQFLNAGTVTASTDWTGTELDPATTNCLFAPAPGTAINQRVGRRVNMKSLKIRGFVNVPAQTNQTVADDGANVRLVVYQDKQTNGAQAQGEDVLTTASAAAVVANSAFMNLANLGKFKVWKDKIITLSSPSLTYDGTNVEQSGIIKPFKIFIKFTKPIPVHFNATGGSTVADIVDNSFHVIAQCSSAALVPNISYTCRVGYTDV